jgi:hypothetical protein
MPVIGQIKASGAASLRASTMNCRGTTVFAPMTTQQLRGAMVSRLADLFRILRERQRQPELGSNQAENPLAIEQSNDGQATSS